MYLNIAFVGIEVIVGLFGHGKGEDHDEWPDVGNKETDSQNLDELGEGVDEEKHVKEEFELVIKHFGDEGENIVLSVFDDIILMVLGLNFSVEFDCSFGSLYFFATVFLEAFVERRGGLWLLGRAAVSKRLFEFR